MRGSEKAVVAASIVALLSAPCTSFMSTAPSTRWNNQRQILSTTSPQLLLLRDTDDVKRTNANFFTLDATKDSSNDGNRINGSSASSNLQSLTNKIEGLSQRLKNEPNEMLEEEASKLEAELRREILTLSNRLEQAVLDRIKDKELQQLMAKEKKELEKEIATLKKEYKKSTNYKNIYEQEQEKNSAKEEKNLAEIARLEKEVRVVFSIGRRTSDKTVEELGNQVKEKEEKLQMAMEELTTKKEYIANLEDERNSLRQLLRLSWRLTSQRLRLQLTVLRKKLSRPVRPIAEDTEAKNTFERQAIRVRKSGRRSSKS